MAHTSLSEVSCCSSCFLCLATLLQPKGIVELRSRAENPTYQQTGYQAPVVIPPAVAMSSTETRLSEKNRLLPSVRPASFPLFRPNAQSVARSSRNESVTLLRTGPQKIESSAAVTSFVKEDNHPDQGPSSSVTPTADHSSADQGTSNSNEDQVKPRLSAPGEPETKSWHRRATSLGFQEQKPAHRRTTSNSSQDTKQGHRRTTSNKAGLRGSGSVAEVACDAESKTLVPQDEDDDFCPTCLEVYTQDNPKIWTSCHHHFHMPCIYEWMERKDTCPICESKMEF